MCLCPVPLNGFVVSACSDFFEICFLSDKIFVLVVRQIFQFSTNQMAIQKCDMKFFIGGLRTESIKEITSRGFFQRFSTIKNKYFYCLLLNYNKQMQGYLPNFYLQRNYNLCAVKKLLIEILMKSKISQNVGIQYFLSELKRLNILIS